jgi:hypothetical protein
MARLAEVEREQAGVVVNVVSQKAPSGCFKSGHLRHHPTPTLELGHDT